MKSPTTFLILLAGVDLSLGQGTTINFNNNGVGVGGDHKVYTDFVGNQPGLVGTNYWAELFYFDTTAGNALTPLASSISKFRVTSTTAPGTWSGKTVTIPIGGIGVPITVEVHVWDAVLNPTGDLVGGAGYKGCVQFVYTWHDSSPNPPQTTDTQMVTMPAFALGFVCIPEPSVLGFGVLGVACLLLFRRRN